MDYVALHITLQPVEPFRELVMAQLAEAGFESFVETETGLEAYIQESGYNEQVTKLLIDELKGDFSCDIRKEIIAAQNWNAVWESDFQPIEVTDDCRVRAPFHEPANLPFELIIQPKMSFGTGHHETTWLILKNLRGMELGSLDVLDMGSGTGVLAVLASKMGAKNVVAIDIDEWCYENALENVGLNGVVNITVEKGDVQRIGDRSFHVILANINKNVLMQDMGHYAKHLNPGGTLIISGFYEADVPDLVRKAASEGMRQTNMATRNRWAMLQFEKQV